MVHLGAPWCGWCKVLEEFLHENAALLADDYIDLKIDIEQMKHGEEVGKKLRGERGGGIPWIVILDSNGQELVSSDGPNGNIGCPMNADEQAYFVSMLEKTRQHAPPERIAEIAKALAEFAQKKNAH